MTKKAQKEQEKAESLAYLQKIIKAGDTVYTLLRHVSQSGMMRHISVVIMKDGEPVDISYSVANVLEYPQTGKQYSLKVGGCGMDMGYSVVHNLSYKLFPNGYKCLGKKARCTASDHVNYSDRRGEYHGQHHKDGYALRHKWL